MNKSGYTLPPEWARQSGVQLTWPHAATDWADYLADICDTYVEMARAIASHEQLLVVAPEPEAVADRLRRELEADAFQRVLFHQCDTNDTWARDHAFITLVANGDGERGADGDAPRLLDFRFNGWGEKFEADKDNRINRSLMGSGMLNGQYVDCLDFVLEGGSIESDGEGTVFTTSQCLLAPHRNQPLDKNAIEQRLRQTLGAKRVVWLDHGNLMGDDTDGHIDTTVRTAPENTLIYVGCDDENDPQYDDFKQLQRQLESLRTFSGQPYRLLRLPMPDPMVDEQGERLPATYANFLVTNEAVLVPIYNQPVKDNEALRTVAEAFKDRRMIAIDSRTIVRQHGSIHCCTMQYPEGILRNAR